MNASTTTEQAPEALRAHFEALASDPSFKLSRSRRGTYVNPAVARDWKWFQLGASRAQQSAPADTDKLRKALQFYADGHHFVMHDETSWDTVSGEPVNFYEDDAGTATVENGSIAKLALAGHPIKFEDEDAPAQPAAPQGVAYAELQPAFIAVMQSLYGNEFPSDGEFAGDHGWSDHWAIFKAGVAASHGQAPAQPIDMVLHCPACGLQHIDAADQPITVLEAVLRANPLAMPAKPRWDNPPHRSHLCHGCGHIWRPADVPTNGVQAVKTKSKADSPIAARKQGGAT